MKRGKFYIRTTNGFEEKSGYIDNISLSDGTIAEIGFDNRGNARNPMWYSTLLDCGLSIQSVQPNRQKAKENVIEKSETILKNLYTDTHNKFVKEMKDYLNGEVVVFKYEEN